MHRARFVLALVTAASLLAACGSTPPTAVPSSAGPAASEAATATPAASAPAAVPSATPSPSATEAPSPSPSAAPDVSAAFTDTISDPLWSPHMTMLGVTKIGTKSVALSGSVDVNRGTSHTLITYGEGSSATTEETISDGSVKYTKQYGAWFKSADTKDSGFGDVFAGTKGFTDAGVETKSGQQLHHMVLPAGTVIPSNAMNIPATATDVQMSLEGWADGEGSPVVLAVGGSWTQKSGATPVPVAIVVEFTVDGSAAGIGTPSEDDQWVWSTSKALHIKIARQSTWEHSVSKSKKYEYFDGYDGSWVGVGRVAKSGSTLNSLVLYARNHVATWTGLTGAKLDKASAARLAGAPARLLQFHGKLKTATKYQMDIIAIKGGYIYELIFSVPRKPTAADLATWQAYVATFSIK